MTKELLKRIRENITAHRDCSKGDNNFGVGVFLPRVTKQTTKAQVVILDSLRDENGLGFSFWCPKSLLWKYRGGFVVPFWYVLEKLNESIEN